jgi:hypothetical protein
MADAPLSTTTGPSAPVQVDLRPLTTSELIDRGFSLYRANFTGFLLLALFCQATPLLCQVLMTAIKLNPSQSDLLDNPARTLDHSLIMLAITLISQVVAFCFDVILTFYIADAYLGKIPSVRECLRKFGTCVGASVWTCVLNILLIFLPLFFPILVIFAAYAVALFCPPQGLLSLLLLGIVALLLFVASLIPVLVIFMRLMVTAPAVALEGLSGWQAIKRSAALVRYDPGLGILYWGEMRLSFLLLPLFVIELLILSITSLPMTIHQLGDFFQHGSGNQILTSPDSTVIISQVMTFLAVALILPLYSIAITLFYYDVRIRREGFDLEFMTGQLEKTK